MKVLFISNYPSPYRVDFFNLLGKQCDLSVCFLNTPEEQKHRSAKWFNTDYSGFHALFLKDKPNVFGIKTGLKAILQQPFDIVVFGGYSSPTLMYAIEYLRIHRIPYYIEADGGIVKKDNLLRKLLKKHFISRASACIGSGSITRDYFIHYGAKNRNIYDYCFTSQKEHDLIDALSFSEQDKRIIKNNLSIRESICFVTIYNSLEPSCLNDIMYLSKNLSQTVGFYVLIINSDNINVDLDDYDNIHIIKCANEFDLAKYLAASQLYLCLGTHSSNIDSVIKAEIFGLPVVQSNNNGHDLLVGINDVLNDECVFEELKHRSLMHLLKILRNESNTEYEINCVELLRKTIRYISKNALGLNNKKMVIAVGQFIHRKGFDILLKASSDINADIYFIGGKPDDDYIKLKKDNDIFIEFLTKDELKNYYRAADVFAMPTREDIWGLVINEALSYGLPVVSSNKCVAGLELIKQGKNGYIVPVEDVNSLSQAIEKAMFLHAIESYKSINNYTLENMTIRHIDIFDQLLRISNGK